MSNVPLACIVGQDATAGGALAPESRSRSADLVQPQNPASASLPSTPAGDPAPPVLPFAESRRITLLADCRRASRRRQSVGLGRSMVSL